MPSIFNRLARLKRPAHTCAGRSADLTALNQRVPEWVAKAIFKLSLIKKS
jgi:hypothetical protein